MTKPNDIIHFWFEEISPKNWWIKDEEFDQLIKQRFGSTLESAKACELYSWRESPQGRLAEIIVLDQFSRNIYRDTPLAFAADPLALALAQEAIRLKVDIEIAENQRSFLYLPFMHSESPTIHLEAVKLYDQPGLEDNHKFELKHKMIIDRFGRYPHRNAILNRVSTAEEIEFLQQPGSSF